MSYGADSKWICEFCTYENFPAAKKCTMCFKWRTPHLISDTINEEQDIYKMAPVVRASDLSPVGSSCSSESGKWACEFCTFLNWPRTSKCVQCMNPRKRLSPSVSSPRDASSQRGTINVQITESLSGSSTPSRLSPNNSSSIIDCHNKDANRSSPRLPNSSQPSSSTHKWVCPKCTYENWPRSLKCVVCNRVRGRLSPDASTASSRSPSSPSSPRNCPAGQEHLIGASASSPTPPSPPSTPRDHRLRVLRACQMRESDRLWLGACLGAVEGDLEPVHAYIAAGGNPSRQLVPQDVELLDRPSAFQVGYTLVHLAIRFQREDMLAILLTATDSASQAAKRLPCMSLPDLATDIRRHLVSSLRQRKGGFPCHYLTDCATFTLPADIDDFSRPIHDQLFDDILDKDVQNELESEESAINWSLELTEHHGSRLYALWNRTAGDCLLDSVLQATWGVFDLDHSLRRCLADSLREGAMSFYPRWKECEARQAESLHFSLDESQWQHDWQALVNLASQPGASLEQTHILGLAHILRRPIIVYAVKYIKSFRGETLGYANFQGVYLPLLWEPSFCWKNPVALGYTRGHFSALVAMDMAPDDGLGAGANTQGHDDDQVAYFPLVDCEGNLLDIHFLSGSQLGREEQVLGEWLHLHRTKAGLLVATQRRGKRSPAVRQMVEGWLEPYRRLQTSSPPQPLSIKDLSSDGESDDE